MVHKVKEEYLSIWRNDIKKSQKLTIYPNLQREYKLVPYLDKLENSKERQILSRYRLSAHSLLIESGRHRQNYKTLPAAPPGGHFTSKEEEEKLPIILGEEESAAAVAAEYLIYKKRYGPWWKSQIGHFKMVNIADPAILEIMVRQEGKYPIRNEIDLWRLHREIRNVSYGPFSEHGEKWHALRTILNKKMLKPIEAKSYAGSINEVVSDFMVRLQELRRQSHNRRHRQ
ncbi:unnamed protein product [Ranitomeya imitator]|uniref:Uncharacterized protein n=1 Tax=Ranitomeya imitator TaxID=111125 RepID=A0ABN9MLE2_9NEOB|nr:unnamed protein product [Ranitomeya imitator]